MSTKELSQRMSRFSGSPTSALRVRETELRRQGETVYSLSLGEPDFDTPNYVKVAGIKSITDGFTKYTAGNGIYELREAIANKLKRDNGIDCTPDEICVSTGAKQAVYSSLMVLCDTGDEVIIPIPCWVSYTEMVRLSGATPILVPCKDDYSLDLDAIRNAVTPKTKAVIICSPNNPTGAVYSREMLEGLGRIIVENDLFVIADEIYEKLIYDGCKHISLASLSDEIHERTITINGFSKAYAMTGWRIGYVHARKDIIKAVMRLQSQITSSNCSISQKAAVEALNGPQDDVERMVEEFYRRKQYVYKRINDMKGISCPEPKGAFYVLADVSDCIGKQNGEWKISSSADFSEYLLSAYKVSTVPGEAFNIPEKIRIAYANSMNNLEIAMDRLEESLKALS